MTTFALVLASWLVSANAASAASSGYTLKSNYDATNFFDPGSFTFYNGWDSFTQGFAMYQGKDQALAQGLANYTDGQVYLGADWEQTVASTKSGNGRNSVRLEGVNTYDNGLFIGDFDHLPSGACGQWPAFWLLHDDGDGYSEIDIIESVSLEKADSVTLYTDPNACTMNDAGGTGTVRGTTTPLDCSLNAGGCGSDAPAGTFGDSFNNNGGGIWATQVESTGIKVWYFFQGNEPADIHGPSPDPTGWGKPMMNYAPNNCNMTSAFRKMKIIINITFCGPYAGQDSWGGFTGCKASTGVSTCESYVANTPNDFQDVFFLINSVRVYQKAQGASSSSSSSRTSSTSTRKSSSSSSSSSIKTTSSSTIKTTSSSSIKTTTSSTLTKTTSTSKTSSTTKPSSTSSPTPTSTSTRKSSSSSSSTRSSSTSTARTRRRHRVLENDDSIV